MPLKIPDKDRDRVATLLEMDAGTLSELRLALEKTQPKFRVDDLVNEIKKDVAVWWKAGAQPPQLLKDNEVQYAICWSGRVVGDPAFGLTFNGGKADLSFIAVVKGSSAENKAAAWKLFHEMSLPENQAKAAEVISYTGPSPNLDPLLPKDKLWQFPTSKQNKAVQYFENAQWWADNGEAVNKKWEAFKLSL